MQLFCARWNCEIFTLENFPKQSAEEIAGGADTANDIRDMSKVMNALVDAGATRFAELAKQLELMNPPKDVKAKKAKNKT